LSDILIEFAEIILGISYKDSENFALFPSGPFKPTRKYFCAKF